MTKKIAVTCDIDGVLNFYPQTLIDYAKHEYDIVINDLLQFKSQHIKKYTEIKSAYRYSSYKHKAKARTLVVDELNVLAHKGYDIVVFTSRPFDRFPGMYDMTFQWLKFIGLNFSTLQSKTKSNFDVIKPLFHLDDRLDHILDIYCLDTTFFLLHNSNASHDIVPHSNIIRVTEHTLSAEVERLIYD